MKWLPILLLVASSLAAQRTITVSGTGHAQLPPDRVSFSVGVATQRGSVADAFRENNDKTARVIGALKAHGVAAPEIQTSNFSIAEPFEGGRRVVGQYLVQNQVMV